MSEEHRKSKNRTRWGDYIREERLELISIAQIERLFWEAMTNINVDDDATKAQKEYANLRMEFLIKRIKDTESETTVILRKVESQYPTIGPKSGWD